MRLCRKVDNRSGPVFLQQAGHQHGIANVAFYKDVALVIRQGRQIVQVARIRQVVKIDHRLIGLSQPVKYKIGANKASASGYQNHGIPC